MKLDEGIQDQKLALDITPLIDIVFLLVLFFAVSTSFISGEDLDVLKTTLVTLTTDKQDLAEEIAQQTQEIAEKTQTIGTLQGDLEKARGDTEELRTVVASLEQQSLRLKATLDDTTTERKSLEQQLKDSLQDFESLNVQLESVKTEKQRQEEKDQLLRSLLLERAQENEQLQQRAATFESQVSSAAENNAALASKLSSAAESNAALAAQLESTKDEQTKQIEKERLLQALLAEKAAKYEDQEVLLVKAGERVASLESQMTGLVGENTVLAGDKENLAAQNAAQARRLAALETTILRIKADLAKFQEVAKLDKAQVERIIQAQQQLEADLDPLLQENKVGIKREKQRLVLQLSDKILFASGSAEIKTAGFEVLGTVGDIIKSRIGTLDVQIAGHTDNVPISSRQGPLSTNWGLSAARAVNVVRFLESDVGIDPRRLQAVGYGENRPIASNDTREGRALNRRIEIVLVPR